MLFLPDQYFFAILLGRELLVDFGNFPLYYCWTVNHISPKPPSMLLPWTWAGPRTQTRTSAEDSKKEELSPAAEISGCKDQGHLELSVATFAPRDEGLSRNEAKTRNSQMRREREGANVWASDQSLPTADHTAGFSVPPASRFPILALASLC